MPWNPNAISSLHTFLGYLNTKRVELCCWSWIWGLWKTWWVALQEIEDVLGDSLITVRAPSAGRSATHLAVLGLSGQEAEKVQRKPARDSRILLPRIVLQWNAVGLKIIAIHAGKYDRFTCVHYLCLKFYFVPLALMHEVQCKINSFEVTVWIVEVY